jgi:hypothetical protein
LDNIFGAHLAMGKTIFANTQHAENNFSKGSAGAKNFENLLKMFNDGW